MSSGCLEKQQALVTSGPSLQPTMQKPGHREVKTLARVTESLTRVAIGT